jgi:predicted DNA-binding mobile mystery protein A
MTQAQLAQRMGISPQAASQLEHREANGSVTLKALERAAQALGARLTYAIVPDRPIETILQQRARDMATRLTSSVRHTMRLEDQEPDASLGQRTEELAEELLSSPRLLWTEPGGP